MNDLTLAIDPDAAHRNWVRAFEWHLDTVPLLIDALVEATLPTIPVSRGGSRFDRDQITGGGYRDNLQLLDHFDVANSGQLIRQGPAADAVELWSWIVGYARAVDAWITAVRPAPVLPDNPSPDPLTARGEALVTAGWLIDHADQIATVPELEASREEMFTLIRRLRAQYGVHRHPRRARPAVCRVCGAAEVRSHWVTGPTGPGSVEVRTCRTCGDETREGEGKG